MAKDTPERWIKVRAVTPGTSIERGNNRHFFREKGEVFDVAESAFSAQWMVKAEDGVSAPPALPPAPPDTTLPAHLQIVNLRR